MNEDEIKMWNEQKNLIREKRVKCDYCGKYMSQRPYRIKKNKHNFCSWRHYDFFRKENNYYPESIDKTLFNKIKKLSERTIIRSD